MSLSVKVIYKNRLIKKALKVLGRGPISKILFKYGSKAATYVGENKLTNQVLHVRSGNLRRSLLSPSKGVKKSGTKVFVGTDLIYGRIHEYGGTILPKAGKYLKFKIGGQFVSVTRVKMPKRPWLKPGVKEYMKKPKSKEFFMKCLLSELKRMNA